MSHCCVVLSLSASSLGLCTDVVSLDSNKCLHLVEVEPCFSVMSDHAVLATFITQQCVTITTEQ